MIRRRFALALVALALLLVGCAGSGESSSTGGTSVAPDLGAPEFSTGGKDALIAPLPYPNAGGDGSALIVTASMSLGVDDVDAAIAQAKRLIEETDGVLVGFSRGTDGYPIYDASGSVLASGDGPAYLVFRLPADALDGVSDKLRTLGEVTGERRDASDVSATLRDLSARLKNLRAAETNYLRLLERAESVTDLLAVQAQLDTTRGEIERLAAEETAMRDAVARSTLSLTLYPPASPVSDVVDGFDPAGTFDAALADLLRLAQGLFGALIYLLVFALPLGLVGLLLFALVRRLRNGRS